MAQTKSNLKTIRVITYFWIALLLSSIVSIALLMQLDQTIIAERNIYKDKLEMTTLGNLLAKKSDFLTSHARNFAVTSNPRSLMLYWNEINLNKQRDYAVIRLKQLSTKKDEIELLEKSKSYSDALTLTEVKSMKLVLDAHNVPENLMPQQVERYILPTQDKLLSPNNKILLAQEILFDQKYELDKKLIMDPIETFESKLISRTAEEFGWCPWLGYG